MAKTKTKSGSKVIVTCPVCGRSMTKAGLIGHMRFKHGKDHKAPMLDVPRPQRVIFVDQEIGDAVVNNEVLPAIRSGDTTAATKAAEHLASQEHIQLEDAVSFINYRLHKLYKAENALAPILGDSGRQRYLTIQKLGLDEGAKTS